MTSPDNVEHVEFLATHIDCDSASELAQKIMAEMRDCPNDEVKVLTLARHLIDVNFHGYMRGSNEMMALCNKRFGGEKQPEPGS